MLSFSGCQTLTPYKIAIENSIRYEGSFPVKIVSCCVVNQKTDKISSLYLCEKLDTQELVYVISSCSNVKFKEGMILSVFKCPDYNPNKDILINYECWTKDYEFFIGQPFLTIE